MNPWIGAALALAALGAGYAGWGWPGVVLAFTVIVFWLLLQFSRTLRVMRQAADRPVGSVDNAVMLQARLHPGLRLLDVLPLTRSLGTKLADDPETFAWTDARGDRVRVVFVNGRVHEVALERGAEPPAVP